MRTIIFKLISIVVLITFLCQNVAWADSLNSPQSTVHSPQMLDNIYIPEQYGRVDKQIRNDPDIIGVPRSEIRNSPLVILIKDAHCHYEAQRNIAKILDILIKDYGIDLVGVEGAGGKVDPSVIAGSPDAKKRKEVADKYLKKGWLTASEVLAMERGKDYGFSIWGVEDLRLYLNDLKAFRDVYSGSEGAERFMQIAGNLVLGIKNRIYTKDVLDFDKKIKEYRKNTLPLTELIKYLYSIDKAGFTEYPNLRLVLKAILLEEAIDFNKVESERAALIRECEKMLPKEEIEQLVQKSLLYKLGKISSLEYYKYLGEKVYSLQFTVYSLRRYIRNIKIHSKIDEDGLFREIDSLIEGIYERYIVDEISRKLHKTDEYLYLLNKLLKLEITRDELERYGKSDITLNDAINFIKIQAGTDIDIPAEITKQPEEFYRYALERDSALIENLTKKMEDTGKDKAVLIVGGFHADGVEGLLQEKGIQVITIAPSITKEDTEAKRIYLERMMDSRFRPEKILERLGQRNAQVPLVTAPDWRSEYREQLKAIEGESGVRLREQLEREEMTEEKFRGLIQKEIEGLKKAERGPASDVSVRIFEKLLKIKRPVKTEKPSISSTGVGDETKANRNIVEGIKLIASRHVNEGKISRAQYEKWLKLVQEGGANAVIDDLDIQPDDRNVFNINGHKVFVLDIEGPLSVTEKGEQYVSAGLRRGTVYITRSKYDTLSPEELQRTVQHEVDEVSFLRQEAVRRDRDDRTYEGMSSFLKDPVNSEEAKMFIESAHQYAEKMVIIRDLIIDLNKFVRELTELEFEELIESAIKIAEGPSKKTSYFYEDFDDSYIGEVLERINKDTLRNITERFLKKYGWKEEKCKLLVYTFLVLIAYIEDQGIVEESDDGDERVSNYYKKPIDQNGFIRVETIRNGTIRDTDPYVRGEDYSKTWAGVMFLGIESDWPCLYIKWEGESKQEKLFNIDIISNPIKSPEIRTVYRDQSGVSGENDNKGGDNGTAHMAGLKLKSGREGLWVKRDWFNNGEEKDVSSGEVMETYKTKVIERYGTKNIGLRNGEIIEIAFDLEGIEVQGAEDILIEQINRMSNEKQGKLLEQINLRKKQRKSGVIVVSLLQGSTHLFEDHIGNGFIGINQQVFDNRISHSLRAKLLRLGLRHELRHEAGTKITEREMLMEDVVESIRIGISDKDVADLDRSGILEVDSGFVRERGRLSSLNIINPKDISSGERLAGLIERVSSSTAPVEEEHKDYESILVTGLFILSAYSEYLNDSGLAIRDRISNMVRKLQLGRIQWTQTDFTEFRDLIKHIPTVGSPNEGLFIEVLEGFTQKQICALTWFGYVRGVNMALTKGCGNRCLICNIHRYKGAMKHIPFPIAVKILKRIRDYDERQKKMHPYFDSDPLYYHDRIINAAFGDFYKMAKGLGFEKIGVVTHSTGQMDDETAGEMVRDIQGPMEISFHIYHRPVIDYVMRKIGNKATPEELERRKEVIKKMYVNRFVPLIRRTIDSGINFDIRYFVRMPDIEDELKGYGVAWDALNEIQNLQDEIWEEVCGIIYRERNYDIKEKASGTRVRWSGAAANLLKEFGVPDAIIRKIVEKLEKKYRTVASIIESDYSILIEADGNLTLQVREGETKRFRTVGEMFNGNYTGDDFKIFLLFLRIILKATDFAGYYERLGRDRFFTMKNLDHTDLRFLKRYIISKWGPVAKGFGRVRSVNIYDMDYYALLSDFFIVGDELIPLIENMNNENLKKLYEKLEDVPFPTRMNIEPLVERKGQEVLIIFSGIPHILPDDTERDISHPVRYFTSPKKAFTARGLSTTTSLSIGTRPAGGDSPDMGSNSILHEERNERLAKVMRIRFVPRGNEEEGVIEKNPGVSSTKAEKRFLETKIQDRDLKEKLHRARNPSSEEQIRIYGTKAHLMKNFQQLLSIISEVPVLVVPERVTLYEGGSYGHARRGTYAEDGSLDSSGIWIGEKSIGGLSDTELTVFLLEEAQHILNPDAPHGGKIGEIRHAGTILNRLKELATQNGEQVSDELCEIDSGGRYEMAFAYLYDIFTTLDISPEAFFAPMIVMLRGNPEFIYPLIGFIQRTLIDPLVKGNACIAMVRVIGYASLHYDLSRLDLVPLLNSLKGCLLRRDLGESLNAKGFGEIASMLWSITFDRTDPEDRVREAKEILEEVLISPDLSKNACIGILSILKVPIVLSPNEMVGESTIDVLENLFHRPWIDIEVMYNINDTILFILNGPLADRGMGCIEGVLNDNSSNPEVCMGLFFILIIHSHLARESTVSAVENALTRQDLGLQPVFERQYYDLGVRALKSIGEALGLNERVSEILGSINDDPNSGEALQDAVVRGVYSILPIGHDPQQEAEDRIAMVESILSGGTITDDILRLGIFMLTIGGTISRNIEYLRPSTISCLGNAFVREGVSWDVRLEIARVIGEAGSSRRSDLLGVIGEVIQRVRQSDWDDEDKETIIEIILNPSRPKSDDVVHMEGLKIKGGKTGLWVNGEDISIGDGVERRKGAIRDSKGRPDYEINGKKIYLSNELLNTLERSGTDISWLEEYLIERFKISPPIKDEIYIDLLSDSKYLFEDHKENGYIGVNRRLFEIAGKDLIIKLLRLGLRHELRHESGAKITEREMLMEDVIESIRMGISDKDVADLDRSGILEADSGFVRERGRLSSLNIINPKDISSGKRLVRLIAVGIVTSSITPVKEDCKDYESILVTGLFILSEYSEYLNDSGLAIRDRISNMVRKLQLGRIQWTQTDFEEFRDLIKHIPTVKNPNEDLFIEVLGGFTQEQIHALTWLGYTGGFNMALTKGCGNRCLICNIARYKGAMRHIPFPIAVKILRRIRDYGGHRKTMFPYFESDPLYYHDRIINATFGDFYEIANRLGFRYITVVTHSIGGMDNKTAKEIVNGIQGPIDISFHIYHRPVIDYVKRKIENKDSPKELKRRREVIRKIYVNRFVPLLRMAIDSGIDFSIRYFNRNLNIDIDDKMKGYGIAWDVLNEIQVLQDEIWKEVCGIIYRERKYDLKKRASDTGVIWTGDAANLLRELGVPDEVIKEIVEGFEEKYPDRRIGASIVESDYSVLIEADGNLTLQVREGKVTRFRTIGEMFNGNYTKDDFETFLHFLRIILKIDFTEDYYEVAEDGSIIVGMEKLDNADIRFLKKYIESKFGAKDKEYRMVESVKIYNIAYYVLLFNFFIARDELTPLIGDLNNENLKEIYKKLKDVPFPTRMDIEPLVEIKGLTTPVIPHSLPDLTGRDILYPVRYFTSPVKAFKTRGPESLSRPSISSTGVGNELQANRNILIGILEIALRQGKIKPDERDARLKEFDETGGMTSSFGDIELDVDDQNVYVIKGHKVIVIDTADVLSDTDGEQYVSAGLRRGTVYITSSKFNTLSPEELQRTVQHEVDEVDFLRQEADRKGLTFEQMSRSLKISANDDYARWTIQEAHRYAEKMTIIRSFHYSEPDNKDENPFRGYNFGYKVIKRSRVTAVEKEGDGAIEELARLLGLEKAELEAILNQGETPPELLNTLRELLTKDIWDEDELRSRLRIVFESAEKVVRILNMVKDDLPEGIRANLSKIQEALTIYVAVNEMRRRKEDIEMPKFLKELSSQLKSLASDKGFDPDMIDGLMEEIRKADGYYAEPGPDGKIKIIPSPYFLQMVDWIRAVFGEELNGSLEKLNRYKYAKAVARNKFKITIDGVVTSPEQIQRIVMDYHGRRHGSDLSDLVEIIARYVANEEEVLDWFKGEELKEEWKVVSGGLKNLTGRDELYSNIPALSESNLSEIAEAINNIPAEDVGEGNVYYLGSGGYRGIVKAGPIDRLDTEIGDTTGNGLRGVLSKFMRVLGRDYLLLSKKPRQFISALYGIKQMEAELDKMLGDKPKWQDDIPLIVEAKTLVGSDVKDNNNGTYTIQPNGEGAVWLIRERAVLGIVEILYDGTEKEKEATRLWLLEHGVNVGNIMFITGYPTEGKAVCLLSEDTVGKLGKSIPGMHRVIKCKIDSDMALASRAAAILSYEKLDENNIKERFRKLYSAYGLSKEKIETYIAQISIKEGIALMIGLPPITPFRIYRDMLKSTEEIVASAA